MKTLTRDNYYRLGFWGVITLLLAVCSYYLIHNAWWIIGDEAIVVGHTGMGKPFSPLGFPIMPYQGRLYPFAYNLYNILLPFNNGFVSPQAHYILQSVALIIYTVFFALIGLHILRDKNAFWKYGLTLCLVITTVARVLPEFITCYTGVWIAQMLLPVFLYCAMRFDETENWGYGAVALITINYISYCYENIVIIPFVIGACALLFNYKHLSHNQKIFNAFLIAGVVLFFSIYAIAILPKVTTVYQHESGESMLMNALRIFVAQKLYWLAVIILIIRGVQLIRKIEKYTLYDSLLLASLAYFVGSALLKLNFTYYYNMGALLSLVALLYYVSKSLSLYSSLVLFAVITIFYGRKIPSIIKANQELRISSKSQITQVADMSKNMNLYWYAPPCENKLLLDADQRDCQKVRLETIIAWSLSRNSFEVIEKPVFDPQLVGVWLVPNENRKLFPDQEEPAEFDQPIFDSRGIKGYLITSKTRISEQ